MKLTNKRLPKETEDYEISAVWSSASSLEPRASVLGILPHSQVPTLLSHASRTGLPFPEDPFFFVGLKSRNYAGVTSNARDSCAGEFFLAFFLGRREYLDNGNSCSNRAFYPRSIRQHPSTVISLWLYIS